ncbi:hypothetical protein DL95DRAFT_389736 [Leptodontidium sp. 2 PMI_412]|nr:hypothetical protein BKA61DRAFT_601992 [Leptodontidium sp. MPI-SDFR-AT-0119]KAH9214297.1 hypothetical protein DL95DRAFT_389736 [Leptodontidium sp. 2 PMI_412]
MKTAILLSAVLGLAAAQNLSGQPACASPCLSSAITAVGCALNDQGCQCGTGKSSIQIAVATCLIAGCSPSDLALAQKVGNELCLAYSSTAAVLTIQTSTGPLTTTGSGLGTTTTATTSLAQTTGTTTGSGSASGTGSSAAATTSPATTSPPSSSVSGSGSAAAGTTSSSTAGAAQGVKGAGVGGVLGLVLGLVAAL